MQHKINAYPVKNTLTLFLLTFSILFFACKKFSKKPLSQGKAGEIYIIMDKRLFSHPVKNIMEQVFNMESPYQVKYIPFQSWEVHKKQRNLLIVGNVNDGTLISEVILSHLSPALQENAKRNLGFIKVENDSFAVPQKIIYAYSGSDSLLAERFLQKGHNLADEFRLFEQTQKYKQMYEQGFEEQLSEQVFRQHDFYLKLPKNTVVRDSKSQVLSLSHPNFTLQVVYADSGQVIPKIEPIQEKKQHIFEFKNIKVLSLYADEVVQYVFTDEAQKRRYVFEGKAKGIEHIVTLQTLFSTFENAPEHNARLKIKSFK
ncbi:MAG: DUF4837 family protein [Bacteroidia bacterium]|nr:DUF4837 family protein [Bacteroidia bacterium]MDW8303146.1 DUF4837 family protein [Bacteroidia bacterium]